jgi:hypothetical protein
MRRSTLPLLVAAALLAGGCGGDEDELAPSPATPAVTAPGTDEAYERGGADGSGADGRQERHPRGGVAGAADSSKGG